MPPKKIDAPRDAAAADWTELRQTLVALHEDLQRTLQTSIMELGETLINRLPARNPLFEEWEQDNHNPFARMNRFADNDNVNHNRRGYQAGRVDQPDNRWEAAFKVEIPEFHGGSRGDALLDWMVSVDEILDFKQVPEERRVPLVAMRFRGHAASASLSICLTVVSKTPKNKQLRRLDGNYTILQK